MSGVEGGRVGREMRTSTIRPITRDDILLHSFLSYTKSFVSLSSSIDASSRDVPAGPFSIGILSVLVSLSFVGAISTRSSSQITFSTRFVHGPEEGEGYYLGLVRRVDAPRTRTKLERIELRIPANSVALDCEMRGVRIARRNTDPNDTFKVLISRLRRQPAVVLAELPSPLLAGAHRHSSWDDQLPSGERSLSR